MSNFPASIAVERNLGTLPRLIDRVIGRMSPSEAIALAAVLAQVPPGKLEFDSLRASS